MDGYKLMKKYTLILLLFIFCCTFAGSSHLKVIARQIAPCTIAQTPQETEASAGVINCGKYTDRVRLATQFVYTGTDGKGICKVRLYLSFNGLNSHKYQAQIYSDSGALPNAAIGTSDLVELNAIGGAETTVDFVFSTPSNGLTHDGTYWVALKSEGDGDDIDDYAEMHYETNGVTERWADYEVGVGWTYVSTVTFKFILYTT